MSKKTKVSKGEQKHVSAWIKTMAHEGKDPKDPQIQAIAYSKVERGEKPPKAMLKKAELKQKIIEKLAGIGKPLITALQKRISETRGILKSRSSKALDIFNKKFGSYKLSHGVDAVAISEGYRKAREAAMGSLRG